MMAGRKTVGGSFIGGIKETQEMIEFAAKHKNLKPLTDFEKTIDVG